MILAFSIASASGLIKILQCHSKMGNLSAVANLRFSSESSSTGGRHIRYWRLSGKGYVLLISQDRAALPICAIWPSHHESYKLAACSLAPLESCSNHLRWSRWALQYRDSMIRWSVL